VDHLPGRSSQANRYPAIPNTRTASQGSSQPPSGGESKVEDAGSNCKSPAKRKLGNRGTCGPVRHYRPVIIYWHSRPGAVGGPGPRPQAARSSPLPRPPPFERNPVGVRANPLVALRANRRQLLGLSRQQQHRARARASRTGTAPIASLLKHRLGRHQAGRPPPTQCRNHAVPNTLSRTRSRRTTTSSSAAGSPRSSVRYPHTADPGRCGKRRNRTDRRSATSSHVRNREVTRGGGRCRRAP